MRHSNPRYRRAVGIARGGIVAATCVGLAAWLALAAESPPRQLHRDGMAMERSSLAVSRGLIREDIESVRKALAELAEHSPPLKREDKEIFGKDIYGRDVAFHQTLLRVREFATVGEIRKVLNEYAWIQRNCLDCHEYCREQGLLPESGPIVRPSAD